MNDKAGIAANQDYGRDEDAAVKALKKHKVMKYCIIYRTGGNFYYFYNMFLCIFLIWNKQKLWIFEQLGMAR